MTQPLPTSSKLADDDAVDEKTRQLLTGWRLWTLLGLLVLAIYAGRYLLSSTPALIETPGPNAEINYDAYSVGITSVLYNAEGRIDYTLEASEQTHFLDNTTVLSNPYVRLYQESGESWNITARSGRIDGVADSDNIERLDLSENVELFQVDAAGERMTLTTGFISLYPGTETMDTDREVTMTTNSLRQTAIGMHVDLPQNKMIFRSQVRGRYEVSSSQP
ncbi:MAG: LPS export ABC transporter periplasmic protein LptC [Pseudomonadota bacterium]